MVRYVGTRGVPSLRTPGMAKGKMYLLDLDDSLQSLPKTMEHTLKFYIISNITPTPLKNYKIGNTSTLIPER